MSGTALDLLLMALPVAFTMFVVLNFGGILTWVERNFGFAIAHAYAGHTDGTGDTGSATTTYVRATLTEVAERLNITKPALYNYFRGKDEILFECWAMGQERVDDFIAGINAEGGTGLGRLFRLQILIATPAAHRGDDQQRAGDDIDRILVPQLLELIATDVFVNFVK